MQVPNLFSGKGDQGKLGLTHNLGIGGAAVVSILRRPEFYNESGQDGRDRVGYNHAHICRPVTRVSSHRGSSRYQPRPRRRSDGTFLYLLFFQLATARDNMQQNSMDVDLGASLSIVCGAPIAHCSGLRRNGSPRCTPGTLGG